MANCSSPPSRSKRGRRGVSPARATSVAPPANGGAANWRSTGSPLFVAAADDGDGGWTDCFDGKIESPALIHGPIDDATLDLLGGRSVVEDRRVGPRRRPAATARPSTRIRVRAAHGRRHLEGECLNAPMRAVTGHRWRGVEQDFRLVSGGVRRDPFPQRRPRRLPVGSFAHGHRPRDRAERCVRRARAAEAAASIASRSSCDPRTRRPTSPC